MKNIKAKNRRFKTKTAVFLTIQAKMWSQIGRHAVDAALYKIQSKQLKLF